MSDLFDMRVERPGIRLHRLELFNWGTFDSPDGEVYIAKPEGRTTLLVGRNGSGKSTLVDAILTILVPGPIRNYNVAAGAKKTERTAKSYVLGACDQQLDEDESNVSKRYLRSGTAFYSVVLAYFCDEHMVASDDTQRAGFTVAQIIYPKAGSGVDHVHLFADGDKSIEGDLAGLTKSDGILASLKARGFKATRTFSEYHRWFVKRTGVKPLAMDMFNQTVAVKDIQSLNKFIRDHMLESTGGKERVAKLIEHFAELRTAHRQLVTVTLQYNMLLPIEKHGNRYHDVRGKLDQSQRLLDAADPFFREAVIELAKPELHRQQEAYRDAQQQAELLRQSMEEANEAARKIRNEIDIAGGARLREIPLEIKTERERLNRKQDLRHTYLDALSRAGRDEVVESEDDFQRVASDLRQRGAEIAVEQSGNQSRRDSLVVENATLLDQRRKDHDELQTLERRRTNLPGHLDHLRGGICQDLGLKNTDLVFASELIAVCEEASQWEASAEMVLRGFALSLLVPEKHYRIVSSYIEQTRLSANNRGQRLVYLRVEKQSKQTNRGDQLHADSLCHKLYYRNDHPLIPWVRAYLENRFDYRCCETIEQFREAPRLAMTKNRHTKVGGMRHEKDDRSRTMDPSQFVLGWDNREKKRRLANRIAERDASLAELKSRIQRVDASQSQLVTEASAISRCLEVTRFEQIDVQQHRLAIEKLEAEEKSLKENNDKVKVLQARLDEKLADAKRFDDQRTQVTKTMGALETGINNGKKMIETASNRLKSMKADGSYERSAPMFDSLREQLGEPEMSFDDVFDREGAFKQQRSHEVRQFRDALEPIERDLTSAMTTFVRKCPEERDDLDANVDALGSYLARLKTIRDEDLPRYEARFKERLNDTVTKEIGVFHSELQGEGRHIERKIDELNEALKELPYNEGTHMRLDVRPVKNPEIADFKASLRSCLDDTFEDTEAAREARFKRIEALIGRLSEQSTWRDRVIDVRRWYDFGACEIETDTENRRGYYEDSSGQSGGEKAKLAFTILVAAIAYQYDLDLTGRHETGFHFVVVDEMFSKIDDRFAEYALKLFERFGLQLIIVAPLDAKARVTEPFVQYYLQVLKDEKQYRSQLVTMTAREYHENVLAKLS